IGSSGKVYLAGELGQGYSSDAFIAEYSLLGKKIGVRQIGSSSPDKIYDIAPLPTSGLVAAGLTLGALNGNPTNGRDAFVMRIGSIINSSFNMASGKISGKRLPGGELVIAPELFVNNFNNSSVGSNRLDTAISSRQFLGPFGNGSNVTLGTTWGGGNLDPRQSTTITFDFLRIDSWDDEQLRLWIGNVDGTSGAEGTKTLKGDRKEHEFTLIDQSGYKAEFKPVQYGGLFGNTYYDDQVFSVTLTLPAGLSNWKLALEGRTDESLDNESYGIDNLVVSQYPTDQTQWGTTTVQLGNTPTQGSLTLRGLINASAPTDAGPDVIQVSIDRSRILGQGPDRFGKQRAIRWEQTGTQYLTRDLGALAGNGDVTPKFLDEPSGGGGLTAAANQRALMLGSALLTGADGKATPRAVISWDGGLLDLNTLLPAQSNQPVLIEAVGLTRPDASTLQILVNSADGKPRQLTLRDLLRVDDQDTSRLTTGNVMTGSLLARSGIDLYGKPVLQVQQFNGKTLAPTSTQNFSSGLVNGSVRWFSLERNGERDDLFAMGQTRAALLDANDDGVIDDRDEQLDARPSDLRLYRRDAAAASAWTAQRLVADEVAVAATTSTPEDGLTIKGNLRILTTAGQGPTGTDPTARGIAFRLNLSAGLPGVSGFKLLLGSTDLLTLAGVQRGTRDNGSMWLSGQVLDAALAEQLLQATGVKLQAQGSTGLELPAATVALPEIGPGGGLRNGAADLGDLDGDGVNDLVISGFGTGTRRTAGGAVVPLPETRICQTVLANNNGTTVLRNANIQLPGLANGSVQISDANGDGRADLILTGEDLFVDGNASTAGADQSGGNPNTAIYLNAVVQRQLDTATSVDLLFSRLVLANHGLRDGHELRFTPHANSTLPTGLSSSQTYYAKVIDANNLQIFSDPDLKSQVRITDKGTGTIAISTPDHSSADLVFSNAVFPANPNDGRWASFDYRFRTDDLPAGVYELRAVPLDHQRSDVILAPTGGLPTGDSKSARFPAKTTLQGTATNNLFILADSKDDFYLPVSRFLLDPEKLKDIIRIENFNPYLDRIQLRKGIFYNARYQFNVIDDPTSGSNDVLIRRSAFSSPNDGSFVALEADDYVARLVGAKSFKDKLIVSNAFSQGNITFADYNQSENPFSRSPIHEQRRDASTSTGFWVTGVGTDADETATQLSLDKATEVQLNQPQLASNGFVRKLRVYGLNLDTAIGALAGGGGNDNFKGGLSPTSGKPAVTYLDGGDGNDTVTGSSSNTLTDVILGGRGNDLLAGLAGRNLLFGEDGDDTLLGGYNDDLLLGGAGIDQLDGAGGSDTADYSMARQGGVVVNLAATNADRKLSTNQAPQVSRDGDGGKDWITMITNIPLANINGTQLIKAAVSADLPNGGIQLNNHGLNDGTRIRLQALIGAALPTGVPRSESLGSISRELYTKKISNNLIALYTDATLTQVIKIDGTASGQFSIYGDISSIENITGSIFADEISGDRQRNRLIGAAGNDTISGGSDGDLIDGGVGNDLLMGDDGADILISGGGRDTLIGGSGSDIYVVGSGLMTLDEAFEALGGRLADLSPIPANSEDPSSKPVTYEQFILLADATRWASVDNKPQFNRFRALGLEPDLRLFERAKLEPGKPWLRLRAGGTTIEAGVPDNQAGSDVAYLDLERPISLTGLRPGVVGLAAHGTSLIVDMDRDGVADGSKDLTIKDYFNQDGTDAGNNAIALRVRGLEATYYQGNGLTNPILKRVDRQVDFNFSTDNLVTEGQGSPLDGAFSAIWDGMLQAPQDGTYGFKLVVGENGLLKEEINAGKVAWRVFVDDRQLNA
ncbi:MAG: PA14 domain-containing protein, partial [Cyanobacteriota bacterium]